MGLNNRLWVPVSSSTSSGHDGSCGGEAPWAALAGSWSKCGPIHMRLPGKSIQPWRSQSRSGRPRGQCFRGQDRWGARGQRTIPADCTHVSRMLVQYAVMKLLLIYLPLYTNTLGAANTSDSLASSKILAVAWRKSTSWKERREIRFAVTCRWECHRGCIPGPRTHWCLPPWYPGQR